MDNGAAWLTAENGLFKVRAASAADRPQGWDCSILILSLFIRDLRVGLRQLTAFSCEFSREHGTKQYLGYGNTVFICQKRLIWLR